MHFDTYYWKNGEKLIIVLQLVIWLKLAIARIFALNTLVDFTFRHRPFVQPFANIWTTYHYIGLMPKSHT